jgi:hypothetical protein
VLADDRVRFARRGGASTVEGAAIIPQEIDMRSIAGVVALVTICSVPLAAQWPTYQAAGVPRDAEGRVRMDAPTPRMPDGKPDFSGNWVRARGEGAFDPPELRGLFGDRPRAQAPTPPVDPNASPIAAFWEIGANIPGGLPLTPWAAELKKRRMAGDMKDNPDANCLPMGLTQFHTHGQPRKVMQDSKLVAIMYEANYGLRYIYLDGRTLPPLGSVQPFWYGYSVGRWEGDTLVVETNNLRGAETSEFDGWLDVRGSPYTEQAKFTERIRRPTYGRLELEITVEDPKAYTKPFSVRVNQQISPDDEIIEFICAENQQFRRRVKID